MGNDATGSDWHKTACILCSISCGIEVKTDGRTIVRVKGDKEHPASQGYTCEKALRLDHYQNGRDRLATPQRRRPDGTFEDVPWDTAIAEIAARFAEIRDTHGGKSIFYYGGGGQANHLGGAYGRATRAALGSTYSSNALAQEKTGEFWVDGQLFGRPRCHTAGDFENAQVAMFIGKNPWQSHGFPRARVILKEIARDPDRTMIVIDPRRTETADLADIFLQVRPGTDAFVLAALLAVLVEEDLVDADFIDGRCARFDDLAGVVAGVDIGEYCRRAGVDESDVREVARSLGQADSVSIFEDLGIQQAPHSTLNSYLEKLLYITTGNVGKQGAMNIHTRFVSFGGGGTVSVSDDGYPTTPVGGHRIISGLVPCNVIPDEILSESPDRFRALLVESANPAHSLADSTRMRDAIEALDFVVTIDVAMTETARMSDYVLPAASQFEKWEASFFTLEFPDNDLHLRAPVFEPLAGTLTEAEIHTRLVRALGALDDIDLEPLHAAAREYAEGNTAAFAPAFLGLLGSLPGGIALTPAILYETLGPALGAGNEAAATMWALAQIFAMENPDSVQRAGFEGEGPALGQALFDALFTRGTGVTISRDPYEVSFDRLLTPDKTINLYVGDLIDELEGLRDEDPAADTDSGWPFVLAAGERRSSTANTIFRDPGWRKTDKLGALRMNPDDAVGLGLEDGAAALVTTKRGKVEATVEISDTLLPGHITLPNGLGLAYPGDDDREHVTGIAPNELTASQDRDWFAGTPWHKHVRARVESAGA